MTSAHLASVFGFAMAAAQAQVAQAEAAVAGAQAALDNLNNQVELQYATIAQTEASKVRLTALRLRIVIAE